MIIQSCDQQNLRSETIENKRHDFFKTYAILYTHVNPNHYINFDITLLIHKVHNTD